MGTCDIGSRASGPCAYAFISGKSLMLMLQLQVCTKNDKRHTVLSLAERPQIFILLIDLHIPLCILQTNGQQRVTSYPSQLTAQIGYSLTL